MFGLGELPKEYNPKVHGPYDPAVYYGPRKNLNFFLLEPNHIHCAQNLILVNAIHI